jgi:ATP-dependent DNA helicase RecQ
MERDELLELTLHTTDASLTFLVPREDDRTINVVAREIDALNKKKKEQVAAVLNYVENNTTCKSLQLVNYFGEVNITPCGICSVCIKGDRSPIDKHQVTQVSKKIIELLKVAPMNSREISERLTFTEHTILEVLKLLVDAKKIQLDTKNKYFI